MLPLRSGRPSIPDLLTDYQFQVAEFELTAYPQPVLPLDCLERGPETKEILQELENLSWSPHGKRIRPG